jgi:hypothetical protein
MFEKTDEFHFNVIEGKRYGDPVLIKMKFPKVL